MLLSPVVKECSVQPEGNDVYFAPEVDPPKRPWITLSPTTKALLNLTKAFLGAAGFALPWALQQGGLVAGCVSLVIFGMISANTLKQLQHCRAILSSPRWLPSPIVDPTYVDIGREAFGVWGGRIVIFGIVAMSLGVCASYLVFVGTTFHSVLAHFGVEALTPKTFLPSMAVPLFAWMPLAAIIALLADYRRLAFTSVVGLVMIFSAMVLVTVYGGLNPSDTHFNSKAPLWFDYKNYPVFFGNAAFLFCIHTVAIPVARSVEAALRGEHEENSTIDPISCARLSFRTSSIRSNEFVDSAKRAQQEALSDKVTEIYSTAVNRAVLFVAIVNIAFAGLCYYFFKETIQESVVQNMPSGTGWSPDSCTHMCNTKVAVAIELCLVVEIVCTYALFIQPISELFEELAYGVDGGTPCARVGIRCGIMALTIILSLAIPHFALVSGLVGGVANTLLGVILPPIFLLNLRGRLPMQDEEESEEERQESIIAADFGESEDLLPLPPVPSKGTWSRSRVTTLQLYGNLTIFGFGIVLMTASCLLTTKKIIATSH